MEKSRMNVSSFRRNKILADRSGEGRVTWNFLSITSLLWRMPWNRLHTMRPNVVFSSVDVCPIYYKLNSRFVTVFLPVIMCFVTGKTQTQQEIYPAGCGWFGGCSKLGCSKRFISGNTPGWGSRLDGGAYATILGIYNYWSNRQLYTWRWKTLDNFKEQYSGDIDIYLG